MHSLVWLLVINHAHLTQQDLTLHPLSVCWDLDLNMIAFLLTLRVSLEEGGEGNGGAEKVVETSGQS